ncbi:hypothetical protein [Streptomyces sp. NPDC026673]
MTLPGLMGLSSLEKQAEVALERLPAILVEAGESATGRQRELR